MQEGQTTGNEDLEKRIDELRGEYNQLVDIYNNKEAIILGERILELMIAANKPNEEIGEIHNSLGNCYMNCERYHEAENILKKGIALNKGSYDAFLMGRALFGQNKLEEALNVCRSAIEDDSNDSNAWAGLGLILMHTGKADEATDAYEKSLRINPKSNKTLTRLANLQFGFGQYKEAEMNYKKALDLKDNYIPAMVGLGSLKNFLKKDDEALRICKKIIDINPEEIDSYGIISNIYMHRKEYVEALRWAKLGLSIDPTYEKLLYYCAENYIFLGLEKDFENTIRIMKNKVLLHALDAIAYGEKNNIGYSIQSFLEAISESDKIENSDSAFFLRDTMQNYLRDNLVLYVQKNGIDSAVDFLEDALQNKVNPNSLTCALSVLVEYAGENASYLKKAGHLFSDIMRNNPDALKRSGNKSRNIVDVISASIVSENVYLMKTLSEDTPEGRDRLEREYRITKLIHSISPKTTSVTLLEQPYMLEKRIAAPSLAKMEENAETDTDLENIVKEIKIDIKTMTEIHKEVLFRKISENGFEIDYEDEENEEIYSIAIPRHNFNDELNTRLISRLGGDPAEFLKEYNKMISSVKYGATFIHGDTHAGNWLKGGMLIDWERPYIGDEIVDLVGLINDCEFSDIDKTGLKEHYKANAKSKDPQFEEKYKIISIHNTMCRIGSRYNAGDRKKLELYIEQFETQTQDYPELQNTFIKYLKNTGIIRNDDEPQGSGFVYNYVTKS